MRAYGMELRERVWQALQEGETSEEVGERSQPGRFRSRNHSLSPHRSRSPFPFHPSERRSR